jgi:Na+-translocating ferredoxin:NAD+ oxidoreductase RnfD subunit
MMKHLLKLNLKTYMLGLLIVLAVIGISQQGISITLPQTLIAILTAILLGLLINYIKLKKIIFSSSAFISGLIIALVLSPQVKWFIPLIASSVAIAQKHLIRYKGKHIFNPANSGLFFTMFISSAYISWWGQSSWPLIVLGGIFICYKMKRLRLPLIFMASFAFMVGLDNILTNQPLLDSFLLINIFFVFVMLIEPKTSPRTRKGIVLYAVLVALFSLIFFRLVPRYDFSILSLALGNAFVPFLNKLK